MMTTQNGWRMATKISWVYVANLGTLWKKVLPFALRVIKPKCETGGNHYLRRMVIFFISVGLSICLSVCLLVTARLFTQCSGLVRHGISNNLDHFVVDCFCLTRLSVMYPVTIMLSRKKLKFLTLNVVKWYWEMNHEVTNSKLFNDRFSTFWKHWQDKNVSMIILNYR